MFNFFHFSWEVIFNQTFEKSHVNIWCKIYPRSDMCYMKQNLFFPCIIVVIIQKLPTYVSNFALCASQNILLHHSITSASNM